MPDTVDFGAVLQAAERLRGRVHRTPIWRCATLDKLAGAELFFKCENLQRVGAFKFRGATNVLAQLTAEERRRGVITHSSGNHAQALALAAAEQGVEATIVMPENAPEVKRQATAGYGARVQLCPATQADRERTVAALQAESGALLVHPYDDARIIAGAGTAALELFEQVDDLDAVLVPVGGGGLAAGTAIVCASQPQPPRLLLCEPAGADDAYRSLSSGVRVTEQRPRTIADGLLTCLGALPFALLQPRVERVLRVEEAQIIHALRTFWERAKLLIEPSSAVALAPLLERQAELTGRRVGVILSGGNVDASAFFTSLEA